MYDSTRVKYYYYNNETGESVWDCPPDYKEPPKSLARLGFNMDQPTDPKIRSALKIQSAYRRKQARRVLRRERAAKRAEEKEMRLRLGSGFGNMMAPWVQITTTITGVGKRLGQCQKSIREPKVPMSRLLMVKVHKDALGESLGLELRARKRGGAIVVNVAKGSSIDVASHGKVRRAMVLLSVNSKDMAHESVRNIMKTIRDEILSCKAGNGDIEMVFKRPSSKESEARSAG